MRNVEPMTVTENLPGRRRWFRLPDLGAVFTAALTVAAERDRYEVSCWRIAQPKLTAAGGICAPVGPTYAGLWGGGYVPPAPGCRLERNQASVSDAIPTISAPRGGIRFVQLP